MKYAVTGATGQLGSLVLKTLAAKVPADQIIALARNRAKAEELLGPLGVEIREADYNDPASLAAALTGVDRLLLISGNEVGGGKRFAQHKAVIEAAQ